MQVSARAFFFFFTALSLAHANSASSLLLCSKDALRFLSLLLSSSDLLVSMLPLLYYSLAYTKACEAQIRARLGITAHFCQVVVSAQEGDFEFLNPLPFTLNPRP